MMLSLLPFSYVECLDLMKMTILDYNDSYIFKKNHECEYNFHHYTYYLRKTYCYYS